MVKDSVVLTGSDDFRNSVCFLLIHTMLPDFDS